MKTANQINADMQLAKTLAPEDVQYGDYVTILTKSSEFPSFYWDCPPQISDASETVNITYRPEDAGQPLKVVDICLPFILAKPINNEVKVIDVRAVRLARISKSFAKNFANLASNKKKKGKKKST